MLGQLAAGQPRCGNKIYFSGEIYAEYLSFTMAIHQGDAEYLSFTSMPFGDYLLRAIQYHLCRETPAAVLSSPCLQLKQRDEHRAQPFAYPKGHIILYA